MRLTPPLLRDPRSESPRGIAARPPVTLCAWGRPAPRADNWLRPAPAGPAFRPRRTAAKQPWAAGRRAQRRRLGSQAPAASAYAFGKARALQARATIGGAHPPDLWAASMRHICGANVHAPGPAAHPPIHARRCAVRGATHCIHLRRMHGPRRSSSRCADHAAAGQRRVSGARVLGRALSAGRRV
jgi:hypothetical protein